MKPASPDTERCNLSAYVTSNYPALDNIVCAELMRHNVARMEIGSEELGLPLVSVVTSLIRDVDFVCSVVNTSKSSSATMFELGIAAALKKPVVIFTDNQSALPIDLSAFTVFQLDLQNNKDVTESLGIFLLNVSMYGVGPLKRKYRPIRSKGSAIQVSPPPVKVREFDSVLEERVYNSILAAGGNAQVQPRYKDPDGTYRPDLVAWIPDAGATFDTPFIVEVKGAAVDGAERAMFQLASYLHRAQLNYGLAIVEGFDGRMTSVLHDGKLIFIVSVQEFIDLCDNGAIGRELVRSRNEFFHRGEVQ